MGRFDVHIERRHWMLRVVATLMNWRWCCSGIAAGDQTLFVTRTAFDRVGGFPALGADGAAAMAGCLLARALAAATTAGFDAVEVCVTAMPRTRPSCDRRLGIRACN